MNNKKIFILIAFILVFTGCNEQQQPEQDRINEIIFAKPDPVEFNEFIFVGMIKRRSGLYRFKMDTKQYETVWSDEKDRIFDLSYSPDRSSAFFISARSYGRRVQLPFIERAALYHYNPANGNVRIIKEFGNGVQIFMRWETDNNFLVAFNTIDTTIATNINQQNLLYSQDGFLIKEEKKVYDLTIDGYPALAPRRNKMYPDNRMFELIVTEGVETDFSLRYSRTDPPLKVLSTEHILKQVEWSSDSRFLFISTINPNTNLRNTDKFSSLYIYSVIDRKLLKQWDGTGLKNFFVVNDLLIFDNGFGQSAYITIINFEEMEEVKQIRIVDGCGIRNIPFLL